LPLGRSATGRTTTLPRVLTPQKKSTGVILWSAHAVEREFQVEQEDSESKPIVLDRLASPIVEVTVEIMVLTFSTKTKRHEPSMRITARG